MQRTQCGHKRSTVGTGYPLGRKFMAVSIFCTVGTSAGGTAPLELEDLEKVVEEGNTRRDGFKDNEKGEEFH